MDKQFRNLDFDPRNLPKEYLEAIGLAAACSAQTEDHMQMAISGLLKVDAEIGWAISTHMTAPLRENVLKSLSNIAISDQAQRDKLEELISNIKQAAEKRNSLVHHLWCIDEETGDVFQAKTTARNAVKADLIQRPIASIIEDARFIYDAGIELLRFLIANNLLPSLPPRDRVRTYPSKRNSQKPVS